MTKFILLETIEDVVAALGGTKAAADWARKRSMSTISNWIARKRIPPGWRYPLDQELRPLGFEVASHLFGPGYGDTSEPRESAA